jgi:hypothetical protein
MVPAMKRSASTIVLLAAAMIAAAPASAAERRFMVVDFEKVQVEGPFEVVLTTGIPSGASATGSPGALDRVSIEVQGTTLHVRPNRSAWGGGYPGQSMGPLRIQISTRALRFASVIGAGSLTIDRVKGLRIDLAVSGNGTIGIAGVDADLLVATINGSGRIALGGKAKQLRASLAGTGDLQAPSFRVDDADIVADTSGAIAVTALRTAKVRANGTGSVAISGSAACNITGLGAGNVQCGAAGTPAPVG